MALYVSGRLQLLDNEPQNELVLLPIECDNWRSSENRPPNSSGA
jgi:hypothetical protein